jgi:hypothetical protein
MALLESVLHCGKEFIAYLLGNDTLWHIFIISSLL